MEFADVQCHKCGKKFGKKKPTDMVQVEPFGLFGRVVEFVSPCPSCGENVPLWEPAPGGPAPAPEPEAPPTEE